MQILDESLKGMRARGQTVKPYFLAGGLDCQNVEEVLGQVECNAFFECIAVDVSTGVETDQVKDEIKIRQFIEIVRSAKNFEQT